MIKKIKQDMRVNEEIRNIKVRLITSEGNMIDDVLIDEALNRAYGANLDLVEMVPGNNDTLSLCKIMDYGKYKYQKSKQKRQKEVHIKEIKIGLSIAKHDLKTKHKQIAKFINKGYKVRYVLILKGREKCYIDMAMEQINNNLKDFEKIAIWKEPKVSGKIISTILSFD